MYALITEIRALEAHLTTLAATPLERLEIIKLAQGAPLTAHQHAVLSVVKLRIVRALPVWRAGAL